MQNLAELQARMNGEDPADALAAATDLTNYFIVYNDEFNALVRKKTEVDLAIMAEASNPNGVDHSEILRLQSLGLGIESRMRVQDARMIAFQASTMAIKSPTPAQVLTVKDLAGQVAVMVARDQAIENIMGLLGQIASIVSDIQGG